MKNITITKPASKKVHPKESSLVRLVEHVWRRWTCYLLYSTMSRIILYAGMVLLPLELLFRLNGRSGPAGFFLVIVPVAAFLIAIIRIGFRPPGWTVAAKKIDEFASLKNEVLSAWSFLNQRNESPVAQIQIEEVTRKIATLHAQEIIPVVLPRSFYDAVLCMLAMIALLVFLPVNLAQKEPVLTPVAELEEVAHSITEELLNDLNEQVREEPDDETLRQIRDELQQEMTKLAASLANPVEALAALSQMEALVDQSLQNMKADTIPNSLNEIGQALKKSSLSADAGSALAASNWSQAETELPQINFDSLPKIDRTQIAQALKITAKKIKERGQNSLAASASQMASSLSENNPEQWNQALAHLARQVQKMTTRKKTRCLLQQKLALLTRGKKICSSCCAGSCNASQASKQSKSGKKPGRTTAELSRDNSQQPPSGTSHLENLTGIQGSGPTESELLPTNELPTSESTRPWQDVYQEYRHQAEAVLESESIPNAQKEIIRHYFEAIRPTQNDTAPEKH